jgi:ATP-dependent helicase HepA
MWSKSDPEEPNRRFRLLHYYRSPYAIGRIEPRFALPGLDPADGKRYAYLDERRWLESPPVPTVALDEDPAAQLHFLDHGNALHEALVSEWSKIGRAVPTRLRVKMPEGHLLANEAGRGTYMVAILSWVPGLLHLGELDRSHVITAMQDARTRLEQKPYLDAIQQMEEDLRSDRRWLNSLFTSRLDVLAARLIDGQWVMADSEAANALCSPWCETARGKELSIASGQAFQLNEELRAAHRSGVELLLREHCARHQRSLAECADLPAKIASRRYLVECEANDLVEIRQGVLDDAVAQGMETSEQGFTRSRFRAIRNARDMALHMRDVRLARLDDLAESLRAPRFSEYKTLMLVVE